MVIRFVDVGCGNMTLLQFPNGQTYLYDCNVTSDNATRVLGYVREALDQRPRIDTFICSHRDADHIRGIQRVHRHFPIGRIRDAGVPGTTTDSKEYQEYMFLRRKLLGPTIEAGKTRQIGSAVMRFMNAARHDTTDVNDQSIVIKVEFLGNSALLASDTTFFPWKRNIVSFYGDRLQSNILLAAHHGSLSFFDDPDDRFYYTDHVEAIEPAMTIVSVGTNPHGLPDSNAINLYKKHSTGSNRGSKVYRTDRKGSVKLTFNGSGKWNLSTER